ncbi:MAG TPA: preprotein translocase subunit SecG [Desulfurobacteriaceae bacterium]|nr:preprotein translocase subunit SecG [Desulfurobacteriaceae bacterium]
MLYKLILTIHIIVCILLILVVIIQPGEDNMSLFGGASTTSVFGTETQDVLTKFTATLGGLFLITSLLLAILKYQSMF